jgi:hypothetical protein
MSDPNDWLDTQTKAQLAACPPEKLAPPTVAGYSLVLLERGPDRRRVDGTLQRLIGDSSFAPRRCPFVIQRALALTDALQGQFELICADSVSVFIADEVVQNATKQYLYELFQSFCLSPEFQQVRIHVESVPQNDDGARFLHQFFGEGLSPPFTQVVARKKARIMQHWGTRLGAAVECEETAT